MVIRMKATDRHAHSHAHRWVQGTTCALALSAALLFCMACTRDDMKPTDIPKDTTGSTTADTTPGSMGPSDGTGDADPLNPDAGTVRPSDDAGDPPADNGNDTKMGGLRSRCMH